MSNTSIILGASRSYKGTPTPISIKVDGVPTILHPQPTQPGRYNKVAPSIAGKEWGVSLTREADYSEAVGQAWFSQGCTNSVKSLAFQKLEFNPSLSVADAMTKALWQVIFNQPSKLYIYAYGFTDSVQGFVKACITNGVNVQLVDKHTERTWEFKAVANKATHPLYQAFELPQGTKNVGAITIAYEKAIKKVEDKIWNKVNAELAEIAAVYFMDKKERTYERITAAKVKELREYLDSEGQAMEVSTFIREVYPVMAETVEKYGAAFGYNLKTSPTEIHKNQFRSQVTYKEESRKYGINQEYARTATPAAVTIPQLRENNVYDGGPVELFWEESNQDYHMDIDVSYFSVAATQKYMAEAQPEYLEVAKAASAIQWILENNLEAALSDNTTLLCPTCNHAIRTNFLLVDEYLCNICDTSITLETLEAFKGTK